MRSQSPTVFRSGVLPRPARQAEEEEEEVMGRGYKARQSRPTLSG